MEIYSNYLEKKIEIDGYIDNENRVILMHNSLEEYMYNYLDELVQVQYEINNTSMEHSVVLCHMSNNNHTRMILAVGETCRENLKGNFRFYPTTTAQQIAFDRASIRYLQLPLHTYSVLEFMKTEEKPESPNEKMDVSDYILSFGVFHNKNMTVKEAVNAAAHDESLHAAIKLYLSDSYENVKEKNKRLGLIALQRYCSSINWEGLYGTQK